MKHKAFSGIMLTLLLIGMLTLAFNVQPVKAEPDTIIVPDDYLTIQEAIGHANPGDTVFVRSGTYSGNIQIIWKNDLRLVGENRHTTIINGSWDAIYVYSSSNFYISGFTIQNGRTGIMLSECNNYTIYDIKATLHTWGQGTGIAISESSGKITNNEITLNEYGIMLNADHNIISNNNITSNTYDGLFVWPSSHNNISGNILSDNSEGIYIVDASKNVVAGNIMSNNFHGIEVRFGSNNTIMANNVSGNTCGIKLRSAHHNDITANRLWNNGYSIEIDDEYGDCQFNVISSNIVLGNRRGIYGRGYNVNNTIFNNYVADNLFYNCYDEGTNIWNISKTIGTNIVGGPCIGGNYYGDYNGVDEDGDGIGETTYTIQGGSNMDFLPLVRGPPLEISILSPENITYTTRSVDLIFTTNRPTSWVGYSLDNQENVTITGNTTLTDLIDGTHSIIVHANDTYGNTVSSDKIYFTISPLHDVAVTSVVPSETEVYEGNIVNISVTVKNEGTVSETLNVTTYYDGKIIQTQTDITLNPSFETILVFNWNTSGTPGNHRISADASVVPGETDVDDNNFTDGITEVIMVVVTTVTTKEGETHPVIVEGNVTITKTNVKPDKMHFKATGPSGSTGWINVTFPKVNTTEIRVKINKDWLEPPPFPIITANNSYYFIYFEFNLSTVNITIQFGSTPVGGISIPVNKLSLLAPYIALTILLAVAVVTVVYVKKRKRHTEINS